MKEGQFYALNTFYFRALQFWGLLWSKTQTKLPVTPSLWGSGLISQAQGKAEKNSIPGDFQGPAGDTVRAFKIPLIPGLTATVRPGNFEFNFSH